MISTPKMKDLYFQIQEKIFYMIPEKWDKIFLYASVIENINYIETGEMFFYYYPKGLLKKNPINVYEIPSKFNLDEQEFMNLAEDLYDTIKDLREEFRKNGQRLWSNLTISIVNTKFNIEFSYENLLNSKYSNEERHIIWNYKYLNEPIDRLNKKDKRMLEMYLEEESNLKPDTYNYEHSVYDKKFHNVIDYNKDVKEKNIEISYEEQELENIMNKYEIKEKKKKINGKEEMSTGRNQILNI